MIEHRPVTSLAGTAISDELHIAITAIDETEIALVEVA